MSNDCKGERLFDKACTKIEEKFGRSIKSISWDEEGIGEAIKCINECCEGFFKNVNFEEASRGERRWQLRKTHERPGESYSEANLERMIAASEDNVYNQFELLSGLTKESGKATIDLVVVNRDTRRIKKIIELKDGSDYPVKAIFQIMFYYLIIYNILKENRFKGMERDLKIEKKLIKLAVLAPKQFYDMDKNSRAELRKVSGWAENYLMRKKLRLPHQGVEVAFEEINEESDSLHKKLNSLSDILGEVKGLFSGGGGI